MLGCRKNVVRVLLTMSLASGTASAAPAPEPQDDSSEMRLQDAVKLGTVATLASLCGLRDNGWVEDLRRASMQSATGTNATDDQRLRAAPGSNLAIGALSFAEAEALEDFAQAAPELSCRPLAASPDLVRADETVRAFRDRSGPPPGSLWLAW